MKYSINIFQFTEIILYIFMESYQKIYFKIILSKIGSLGAKIYTQMYVNQSSFLTECIYFSVAKYN